MGHPSGGTHHAEPAHGSRLTAHGSRLTALGALTLSSLAHSGELVDISVEIDGWTMIPIVDNGATSAIAAIRNDDDLSATDIDVVLYERTSTGWNGSAYHPSVTVEDALLHLASEFTLRDPSDGSWHIDFDQTQTVSTPSGRSAFGKGFFATDPLFAVAQSVEDPEPIAETAESAGFPAASGAAHTGMNLNPTPGGTGTFGNGGGLGPIGGGNCGCDTICINNSIAAGVDAQQLDSTMTFEDMEQTAHDVVSQAACCIPWSWTQTSTQGSCAPQGNWMFVGSDPPVITGSSGAKTCHYERVVVEQYFRVRIKRCLNCTRYTRTQTRTKTGIQKDSSLVIWHIDDPVPPCPSQPKGAAPPCRITEVTSTTPWGPPMPSCP